MNDNAYLESNIIEIDPNTGAVVIYKESVPGSANVFKLAKLGRSGLYAIQAQAFSGAPTS